jgi:hypothetical protein
LGSKREYNWRSWSIWKQPRWKLRLERKDSRWKVIDRVTWE